MHNLTIFSNSIVIPRDLSAVINISLTHYENDEISNDENSNDENSSDENSNDENTNDEISSDKKSNDKTIITSKVICHHLSHID